MDVQATVQMEKLMMRGGLTPWSIPAHAEFIKARAAAMNVAEEGSGDAVVTQYEELEAVFNARMEQKGEKDAARVAAQKEAEAQRVVIVEDPAPEQVEEPVVEEEVEEEVEEPVEEEKPKKKKATKKSTPKKDD